MNNYYFKVLYLVGWTITVIFIATHMIDKKIETGIDNAFSKFEVE